MPPKPKFTRDQVIETALQLVSENGIDCLTARELGTKLGSSARPIFTLFSGMDELVKEFRKTAMHKFENMPFIPDDNMPIFKKVGIKMITFAIDQPKLYQLLFMEESDTPISFDKMIYKLGPTADYCISAIQEEYKLDCGNAKSLFENIWIYTFGIGTLCATKMCTFNQAEISDMLTNAFNAAMLLIKKK